MAELLVLEFSVTKSMIFLTLSPLSSMSFVCNLSFFFLYTVLCASHSVVSNSLWPHSLSMEFSRQGYWSGLPFPSPGDLPDPRIEPGSPALQADALLSEPPGNPTAGRFFTIWASREALYAVRIYLLFLAFWKSWLSCTVLSTQWALSICRFMSLGSGKVFGLFFDNSLPSLVSFLSEVRS